MTPTLGLGLAGAGRFGAFLAAAVADLPGLRVQAVAEIFNVANHVNYSGVMQRAFLVGTADSRGVIPLTFQDAATVATEGLNVRPFGTFTEASSGEARERQVQLGVRVEF